MLHKNTLLRGLSLGVLSGFMCLPIMAQAQQCDVIPEMVTKLFHPDFATYTVWNTSLGEGQKQERFKVAMAQGDGVLAIGEMVRLKNVAPVLMMARFDRRGREVWTKYLPLSGLSEIVKVLPFGEKNEDGEQGFVLLANMKKKGERSNFWIGFFDSDAKLMKHSFIKDDHFDLVATDIQFKIAGSGFVIPVSAMFSVGEGKLKTTRQNAVVYALDEKGNEISSRAFVLGGNNSITSLSVSNIEGESRGYIATGWFENDFGKTQGWLLKLNQNLAMTWQKEFSRGKSAKLLKSVIDKNGHYIAAGSVEPLIDGPQATWLAALDSDDGALIWQRYYFGETGVHDYAPIGLVSGRDGVVTLAMQALYEPRGMEQDVSSVDDSFDVAQVVSDDADYVHFLTLNTRGVTLSGDSYMSGHGLNVFDISPIYDGRILMSGVTQVPAEDIFKKQAQESHGVNSPLQEPSVAVTLPEVEMSDKAKKGLAQLRQKIGEQGHDEGALDNGANQVNDSAKSIELTDDGWIGIADAPKAYSDPCEK